MSATYLDGIVAAHRRRAAQDTRPLDQLVEQAASLPAPRSLAAALRQPGQLSVIAEIKRRSPSRGDLAPDLDPATVADRYQQAGAAALSVLTDEDHFGGSADDLRAARDVVDLPVLRKDFTVDARDLADARIMGADALLLIVAALADDELVEFLGLAARLDMDALVEVHDEIEVERAAAAGATLIGVNQRDLATFAVDHRRAAALAASLPASAVRVAESGIRDSVDAQAAADAGYDAVLVGESLVTADDPGPALRSLTVATGDR